MRILLLSLALLPSAAVARDPVAPVVEVSPAKPICQNARTQMVKPAGPATARKLGDLPQAKAYRTVLRLEDGCDVPVVINEQVGEQR